MQVGKDCQLSCLFISAREGEHLIVLDAVLDVDEADNLERLGQLGGPVADGVQALFRDGLWWDAARRVTCMAKSSASHTTALVNNLQLRPTHSTATAEKASTSLATSGRATVSFAVSTAGFSLACNMDWATRERMEQAAGGAHQSGRRPARCAA